MPPDPTRAMRYLVFLEGEKEPRWEGTNPLALWWWEWFYGMVGLLRLFRGQACRVSRLEVYDPNSPRSQKLAQRYWQKHSLPELEKARDATRKAIDEFPFDDSVAVQPEVARQFRRYYLGRLEAKLRGIEAEIQERKSRE